jgi:hypothetical protein
MRLFFLAVLTIAGIVTSTPASAQSNDSAEGRPSAQACSEIQEWFALTDSLFQRAGRSPNSRALQAYADATFADAPGLAVMGSSGFTFRSIDEFMRLVASAGYQADSTFTVQTLHASVALVTPDRALYVRRFAELDASYVARGRTAPYLVLEAGTLVRYPMGWRMLERVTPTGNSGPTDSTTAVVQWECR